MIVVAPSLLLLLFVLDDETRSSTIPFGYGGGSDGDHVVRRMVVSVAAEAEAAVVVQHCSPQDGGGVCPVGNTCCPSGQVGRSMCISTSSNHNNHHKNKQYPGVCCSDTVEGMTTMAQTTTTNTTTTTTTTTTTGCSNNYTCATFDDGTPYCQLIPNTTQQDDDIPERLPRYKLCSLPAPAFQRVHGLEIPIHNNTTTNTASTNTTNISWVAAYLTSTGIPLDSTNPVHQQRYAKIHTVVITIHGSRRNADDYLCCTHSAALSKNPINNNNDDDDDDHGILVIAPWFLAPQDGPIVSLFNKDDDNIDDNNKDTKQSSFFTTTKTTTTTKTRQFLQWKEKSVLVPHTWRYGANSIQGNIGSYAVMDAFLDYFVQATKTTKTTTRTTMQVQFPKLQRIVITGHSAGGQYTQRWSLLSNHVLLDSQQQKQKQKQQQKQQKQKQSYHSTDRLPLPSTNAMTKTRTTTTPVQQHSNLSLRVVVANPKSFCYLDGRRFLMNETGWSIPSHYHIYTCPIYNEWQWGFGPGNFLPTPYKDQVISQIGVDGIITRYQYRPIVYLSGHLDVVLNGQCMDKYQGRNRRERSRRYYDYLNNVIYNKNNNNKKKNDNATTTTTTKAWRTTTAVGSGVIHVVHNRLEVPHVHHDHCLLYQSYQGHIALFGNESELWDLQQDYQQQQLLFDNDNNDEQEEEVFMLV